MKKSLILAIVVAASACASDKPVNPPPGSAGAVAGLTRSGAPATKTIDATETHHGVVVADPYRWLEQPHDKSADVKTFIDVQNTLAR